MPMNFGFSPAGQALGLTMGAQNLGTDLSDQVANDTEELRKKRMLEAQQRAQLGLSGSAGSSSPAGSALGLGGSVFGSMTNTGLLR
jgi:hypothetical protein